MIIDFSDELVSIFRVQVKMEALRYSETLVKVSDTKRRHNPQNRSLNL